MTIPSVIRLNLLTRNPKLASSPCDRQKPCNIRFSRSKSLHLNIVAQYERLKQVNSRSESNNLEIVYNALKTVKRQAAAAILLLELLLLMATCRPDKALALTGGAVGGFGFSSSSSSWGSDSSSSWSESCYRPYDTVSGYEISWTHFSRVVSFIPELFCLVYLLFFLARLQLTTVPFLTYQYLDCCFSCCTSVDAVDSDEPFDFDVQITILVDADGVRDPPTINCGKDLELALQKLYSIPASK
ncbi:hypothetical protein JCGZ_14087 [Jatropha curcas]|uniref:Uncharacterized protein n=1 Tax=Jatropha curcas TaxID=180498 RepID=A0A067JWH8_JATCU|nr:hypothetical protein JCGZ_14087 [Jatropha curcas]